MKACPFGQSRPRSRCCLRGRVRLDSLPRCHTVERWGKARLQAASAPRSVWASTSLMQRLPAAFASLTEFLARPTVMVSRAMGIRITRTRVADATRAAIAAATIAAATIVAAASVVIPALGPVADLWSAIISATGAAMTAPASTGQLWTLAMSCATAALASLPN